MGEVIHVDFKARKRLPVTDITPRRMAKMASRDSMELQAVPPVGGAARYNRRTQTPSRDEMLQKAVRAIIDVENIDEESGHLPAPDVDETSPYQRLDESLLALTDEERDMAWDEAHRQLEIDQ